MRNIPKNILILLGACLLTVIIFWQFFFKGLYPYPGDFLLAWYEPWKSSFTKGTVITISHKPIADDLFRQLYPYKVLLAKTMREGQLPLWNPYNGSGMPFFATMHMGFLNPFNFFFLILSPPLAWSLYIVIQSLLLAFFTFLYCRKIGMGALSSVFSTLVFCLSGVVVARIIFGEYIYCITTMPILLYLIESYMQDKRSKKILLFPVVVFLLFISGQPQVILYVLLFSFLYMVMRTSQNDSFRFRIHFLILYLLGIGLSSIQLFPTFELFQNAGLNSQTSKFIIERFLLPFEHLVSIFVPNYFGNQSTYNYWGFGDYIETVGSIGLLPFFFAFLGLSKKINKTIQFFYIVTLGISVILSINWIGSRLLFSLPIPILSTGAPSRIFLLTSFSISMLAGFGLEKFISLTKISKEIVLKFSIFILFISLIAGWTFLNFRNNLECPTIYIANCRIIALRNTLLEVGVFLTGIISLYIYIKAKNHFSKNTCLISVLILILSIGFYNSNKFLPFSKKETFYPKNELISELIKKTDGRVFGLGEANIKTDFATLYGFYDPNYYDPLYNKRYAELVSYANKKSPDNLSRSDIEIINELNIEPEQAQRRNRLFELLSVKYLIFKKSQLSKKPEGKEIIWEDKNWYILKNTNALPRAYLVSNYEIAENNEKILEKLFNPNYKPSESVVIEKKSSPLRNQSLPVQNMVLIEKSSENEKIVKYSSSDDSILVETENYYPGWEAYVDGKKVDVLRANYSLRAIFAPAGKHDVYFVYRPASLKIGLITSLCSAFFYLIFVVFWKKVSTYKNEG